MNTTVSTLNNNKLIHKLWLDKCQASLNALAKLSRKQKITIFDVVQMLCPKEPHQGTQTASAGVTNGTVVLRIGRAL